LGGPGKADVKYQVFWTEKAEEELARIWLAAEDRDAIRLAADSPDRELASAPHDLGESRPGGRRIAHWLPLGISFEIHEEDRSVKVLAVWECRKIRR
jgi:plasmid stabilization system protein ParE